MSISRLICLCFFEYEDGRVGFTPGTVCILLNRRRGGSIIKSYHVYRTVIIHLQYGNRFSVLIQFVKVYNLIQFISLLSVEFHLDAFTLMECQTAIFQFFAFVAFTCYNRLDIVLADDATGVIIGICMQGYPVGCKYTEFQPLVVGVIIANIDGRSEGCILCSMCIDIHIRFCSVLFFFECRQSRFLSFAVGTFSVECRNRIIYCGRSNLGIRQQGNLGTCTGWEPEGCTRSEGAPVVKLFVSDISLLASVAPEGNISPVWLIVSTFAYLHPYFCGPEHLLVLSDIHGLSAYLSVFFRCRIIIFLHFSGEVISDNRVVGTVVLSGIVHFEYWNQIDGFSFFTERIGIAEFVFGCVVF